MAFTEDQRAHLQNVVEQQGFSIRDARHAYFRHWNEPGKHGFPKNRWPSWTGDNLTFGQLHKHGIKVYASHRAAEDDLKVLQKRSPHASYEVVVSTHA